MDLESIISIVLGIMMMLLSLSLTISILNEYRIRRAEAKKKAELDEKIGALLCDIFEKDMGNTSVDKKDLDYSSMNVAELKSIARQREIKGYYRLKKDELIKELQKGM